MDQTLNRALEPTVPGLPNRPSIWRRLTTSRHVWAFTGALLALIVVAASMEESASHTGFTGNRIARFMDASVAQPAPERSAVTDFERRRAVSAMSSSLEANGSPAAQDADTPDKKGTIGGTVEPMIAQTASLTIVPANYDQAASSIDSLVAAHGGYVQKLESESQTDSARALSVTLRVPVKQLGSFLADLRKLGRVEAETRENEEVTDQYVDLDARLQNARAGEQRLIQLLAARTGKLEDVLDAERELTRVRGDIESMTGERNLLLHRVEYATLDLQLAEQYRAQLSSGSPAGSVRNALVEGFQNLETGAIAALEFVLAYGPSLLFWLAIFGGPSWLVWRIARRRFATPE